MIQFLPFRAFCVEWSPKIDDVSRLSVRPSVTLRSGWSVSSASSRAITQKLEFTVFLLCIVKLFCWFWFRFFRWLQMIEKIEDWFAIIGFIWKICIILYHLHHLRAIIKKVEVFCFLVVYLKAVLFVFVSFYSDDCRWLKRSEIDLR